VEIEYSEEHWNILKYKRKISLDLLYKLNSNGLIGYVYGSVARGDVRKDSDIDIIVLNPNIVELDLIDFDHKYIVQATPFSTPKAYISLDPEESKVISFPLSRLKKDEEEFYRFGGMLDYHDLEKNIRVAGINKKLEIIIPTEKGHYEISLKGNEDLASKTLKISISTILEREKLLTKRVEKGRTGVFLRYDLNKDESFESSIRILYKKNKFFRRMIDA